MSSQDENPESSSVPAQIDLLCDRFETAWKTRTPPDLATYLQEIEETSRPLALRQLLHVELEMRRARGDSPTLDEYQRRFPEQASLIAGAFQSFRRNELDTIDTPLAHVTRGFHVSCPHCHNPIELVPDANLSSIECKSCGGSFSLTGSEQAAQQARGSRIGHFELIERLGMGAFGSVWRARDTKLDRTVAVKIPRKGQLDAAEAELFLREARSAAQLRHPNIVSVHEVGRDNDSVYLVSDLIQGMSLDKWIAEQRLAPREAADICAKIADALQHAHERGVIHRDLKPQNVLMDAAGEPHLTDFGLAKRETGEITMTIDGQLLGTPAYMSPEQAQGEAHAADGRSDVYSMGVILFQLLTGELPFRGNARMLLHQVIHDEPPSPRKLNANIKKDLETITLKCLEKQPAQRYHTARELAVEIRRYLSGEPILARPIGRVASGWRWMKRRPAAAALLGLLMLVAVVGPVVALQQSALVMTKAQALGELARKNDELQSQLVRNLIERGAAQAQARRFSDAVAIFAAAYAAARPDDQLRTSARNLAAGWSENLGLSIVQDSSVGTMAFSPDGSTILAGGQLYDAATGKPIGEPMRHQVWGSKVAFSADGRTMVTAGWDNTVRTTSVRLWDTATGKPIGQPISPAPTSPGMAVNAVALAPDSRTVLTASKKNARLWDVATGKPIGEPMPGSFRAVALSADGSAVLTGGSDIVFEGNPHDNFTIIARLWDPKTGKPIGEVMRHDAGVIAVALRPDGKALLTASEDHSMRLWNAADGKPIGEPMRHNGTVRAMAFSPNGRTVLSASDDKTARLWSAKTGKPIGEPMRHDGGVTAIAFSRDGRFVLTGSDDSTARLWDAMTSKPIGEPIHHDHSVTVVAFSPNGDTILTGGAAHVRRIAMAKLIRESLHHAPDAGVFVVAFSLDGRKVITAGGDDHSQESMRYNGDTSGHGGEYYAARLWDAKTGKPVGEPMHHTALVTHVAFSPDGRSVLTANEDSRLDTWRKTTTSYVGETTRESGAAHLWDASTGKHIGEPMRHVQRIRSVAFSPNGRTVVTGSVDGLVRFWDAANGKLIGEPIRERGQVAAFSPDGLTVAIGSTDARLWGVATREPIGKLMRQSFGNALDAITFSRDGRFLMTPKNMGICVWDAATQEMIGQPIEPNWKGLPAGHDLAVFCAASLSHDGRMLVTGSSDSTARVWDVATGKPISEPMRHSGLVHAVAFSPDGLNVLTGSLDGTACLWDATTGKPIREPERHDGPVYAVAFSPDGQTVLTGSGDHTARLSDVPQQLPDSPELIAAWAAVKSGLVLDEQGVLRSLTQAEWLKARNELEKLGGNFESTATPSIASVGAPPRNNLISDSKDIDPFEQCHWDIKFFHYPDAGPDKPPGNWPEVIARKPVATSRVDQIDFDWGMKSPHKDVHQNHFAILATSTVSLPNERSVNLMTTSDDGIRLYVDDKCVIDNWTCHISTENHAELVLAKGAHTLRIEYFEGTGLAKLELDAFSNARAPAAN